MLTTEYLIPIAIPNVNGDQIQYKIIIFKESILVELLAKRYNLKCPSEELNKFVFNRVICVKSTGFGTETYYVDRGLATEDFLFKAIMEIRDDKRMYLVIECENTINTQLKF